MSKEHKIQLEGASTGQTWDKQSNKMSKTTNNLSNKVKIIIMMMMNEK